MKLKKFFKAITPTKDAVENHKYLRIFGSILQDPNIFHLTRRSAAAGTSIGIFIGFLPIPGHMLLAALFSIIFRVNLPLAVTFTWVSNPVTTPPIFYLAYKFGSIILDDPIRKITFEMTWAWFGETFNEIWLPLLVGSLVLAVIASIIGYITVRLLWRIAVVQKWKIRKKHRQEKNEGQGI